MKSKLLMLLAIIGLLYSCHTEKEQFEVHGRINGVENCELGLYIENAKTGEKEQIATTPLVDGTFSFKGKVDGPKIGFLKIIGSKYKHLDFILDNTTTLFYAEFERSLSFKFMAPGYQEEVYTFLDADPNYRYNDLQTGAAYSKSSALWKMNKKEEGNDAYRKFMTYSSRKFQARDNAIRKVLDSDKVSALRKAMLISVYNFKAVKGKEKEYVEPLVKELGADNYFAQIIQRKLDAKIAHEENVKVTAVGNNCKNVIAIDFANNQQNLKEVLKKNKYTMLEFWASWCAPCRAEIPNMKEAYEKFHEKGFEVYSVSIDKSKKAWEKASNKEDIPWINTLNGESGAKHTYAVTGVPTNFIIDSNGTIVAKNVRGEQLEKKLEELLK